MSKKIISLILTLLLIVLSFAGCGKKAEVKINGTDIDNEVTAYFRLTAKEGEDANRLIARYVAINSEFVNCGLTVPKSTRADISENVNDIWHLWGEYYEENGISKQTIYKIELSKVYETLLLEERYGENGVSPLSDDEIRAFFRENYASLRFVTGYLFEVSENGSVPMTDEQKTALIDKFSATAEAVNGGTGIEEAVSLLGSAEIHNVVVTSSGNDNFPDGFWDEVKKIDVNKCAVVTLGSYVFLVQKVNGEEGEFECYSEYRSDCISKMKGTEFEQIVDMWAEQYK